MKSALYMEDGYTQVVLTPENDFDKAALAESEKAGGSLSVKRGEFYHCAGGWVRQNVFYDSQDSLMLIVRKPDAA